MNVNYSVLVSCVRLTMKINEIQVFGILCHADW